MTEDTDGEPPGNKLSVPPSQPLAAVASLLLWDSTLHGLDFFGFSSLSKDHTRCTNSPSSSCFRGTTQQLP